jgi:hypothetical protein
MPPNERILQNILAFAVLVAAVIGVWYFGFHKPQVTPNPIVPPPLPQQPNGSEGTPQYKTENGGQTTPTTGQSPTSTGNKAPKLDEEKQLKQGSKGDEVKALQTLCNKIIGKINAEMDAATDWSTKFGTIPKPPKKLALLTVDGSFGAKTTVFLTTYLAAASFYTTLKLTRYHAKFTYSIE